MEILKASTDWARAEVFSSSFFVMFGLLFMLASIGFWYLGKTEIAKAFNIPTMVAGVLLLIIGLGIMFANHTRQASFTEAYENDAPAFITSEIARTEKSMREYATVVFKAIPFIIILCALAIMFIETPIWRSSAITILAMMAVILVIDSNANARIEAYHTQLLAHSDQKP